MAAVPDFARKFGLVLKTLNLSRGRLAQAVGIDKSVVSRWASGTTVPTDHNLSLLTEAIVRHKADFGRHDWDLDVDAFTARLGIAREAPAPAAARPVDLSPPARPSIAVLPFTNMGGDPAQEYFADGIAEDIITALSRFRSLFVIARNSSFTYRGRTVDMREIGRDLGVRYVLEGSVRRAGGQGEDARVRFTAQLIDAATGIHVWADKHDGPVGDLFELQDRITEAVVSVLEPAIQRAEIERMRRKRPGDMGAYDWFLRSLAQTDAFTRESIETMRSGCLKAIALDPSFAPAYALAARAYIQWATQGWLIDEARQHAEALDLVERGLAADRLDPMMLATAGHCFAWFARDLGRAVAYIDEAIAINPNYAHAFMQSGQMRTRTGDTRTAIDHLERAHRLSPRDSRSYAIFKALAEAHHIDGDVGAAGLWARRAVQHNPNYLPGWYALAAVAGSTGSADEARVAARQVLALDPAFSIARLARRYPIDAPEKFEIVFQGLRKAGLPA
ncbi:MAG: helix-turn-helix domain-containing protein [Alphaproteobacteria bacterium]|nr:helix-turn-helix domain-containing protein [Alphaproteobacteria bacterium]